MRPISRKARWSMETTGLRSSIEGRLPRRTCEISASEHWIRPGLWHARLRRETSIAFLFGCVVGVLPAPFASGQQAIPQAGSIAGHVTYSDTQQPARLSHVVLLPVANLQSPAPKDDGEYHQEGTFHFQPVGLDGNFVVSAVPPGTYYVIVEQDGYVSPLTIFTREQLRHPDEATQKDIARYMNTVAVAAGRMTQTEIKLVRGGEISGTVHFEDGSPGINVRMKLLKRNDKGEWLQARTGTMPSHVQSATDENGTYKFLGLATGEYLVCASIELVPVTSDYLFGANGSYASGEGYKLNVYPGDTFRARDATPVKVQEGETAAAVDVDVPVSKLYSIRGTVERPGSASPANAAHLTLQYADDGTQVASADVSSDDGSFQFDFVPGGNYTLKATNVEDVQRTEKPTCKGCMPPVQIETKVLVRYGDGAAPIELTNDLGSVVVQAAPLRKP